MTAPSASERTKATGLFPFLPKEQLDGIAKISALLGVSFEAATALQLCRETLRDYCPPDETAKVIAALVGLESRARR